MDSPFIQILSSILSTLTIMSCLFLKVPQIWHIRQTKSTKGLYIQAMLMEILSFTTVTLYNYTSQYSVITYLEYPIILVQIYVLLFYTLKYKGMINSFESIASLSVYAFLVFAFVVGLFPKDLLSYILPLCTPVSGFAKVTYIYGMIKHENADSVSLATWVISVSTNLARLFTVYVDSADLTLMLNFIISASLSAGVLATAAYYKQASISPSGERGIAETVSYYTRILQKNLSSAFGLIKPRSIKVESPKLTKYEQDARYVKADYYKHGGNRHRDHAVTDDYYNRRRPHRQHDSDMNVSDD